MDGISLERIVGLGIMDDVVRVVAAYGALSLA